MDETCQVWDSDVPCVVVVGFGSEGAFVEDVCGMVVLQLRLDEFYCTLGVGVVFAFVACAFFEFSEQCARCLPPVLGLRHLDSGDGSLVDGDNECVCDDADGFGRSVAGVSAQYGEGPPCSGSLATIEDDVSNFIVLEDGIEE